MSRDESMAEVGEGCGCLVAIAVGALVYVGVILLFAWKTVGPLW